MFVILQIIVLDMYLIKSERVLYFIMLKKPRACEIDSRKNNTHAERSETVYFNFPNATKAQIESK